MMGDISGKGEGKTKSVWEKESHFWIYGRAKHQGLDDFEAKLGSKVTLR